MLTNEDRRKLWGEFMSDASSKREILDLNKYDLRDALDATDQWIEDNQVSYNQAIPQPARSNLTATQKANLLLYVVRKRMEVE